MRSTFNFVRLSFCLIFESALCYPYQCKSSLIATSDIVMSAEYIIIVLPLWSNLVRLREHHSYAHQQEEDWADCAGECGVSVWNKAPSKTQFKNHIDFRQQYCYIRFPEQQHNPLKSLQETMKWRTLDKVNNHA